MSKTLILTLTDQEADRLDEELRQWEHALDEEDTDHALLLSVAEKARAAIQGEETPMDRLWALARKAAEAANGGEARAILDEANRIHGATQWEERDDLTAHCAINCVVLCVEIVLANEADPA